MDKKKRLNFICASLFFIFILYSCKSPLGLDFGEIIKQGDIIKGTGTVTYIGVEGGFYGIITANNGHWDPINLHTEFKIDGLRVEFKARIKHDLYSTHMWGILIELILIKKLE